MTDRWCGLREEDRDAVRAFARANGRGWRRKLCDAWERACAGMTPEAAGPMLRARAALGPSGLARLAPEDIAGALPALHFGLLLHVATHGPCVFVLRLPETDAAVAALVRGGLLRAVERDGERTYAATAAGRRALVS